MTNMSDITDHDHIQLIEQTLDLASRCFENGQSDEAEKLFTATASLDPGNVIAHYGLAMIRLAGADHSAALDHLRAADRGAPGNEEIGLAMIECLVALRRDDEARQAVAKMRTDGCTAPRLEVLALHAGAAPALPALEALARKIPQRRPPRGKHPAPQASPELAPLLAANDWPRLGGAAFDALRRHPGNGGNWDMLGVACLQQHHIESARYALRTASRLLASDPAVWDHLGIAERLAHHPEESRRCFQTSLKLAPRRADTWVNWGNLLQDERNLADAMTCFEKALSLDPESIAATCNLGNVLREQGKNQDAADCYRKLLAKHPELAEAHCNLGNILRDLGHTEESIACYRHALVLAPKLAEAHSGLGRAMIDRGLIPEAIAHYERALALRPDLIDVYSLLLKTSTIHQFHRPERHLEIAREYGRQLKRLAGSAPARPKAAGETRALRVGLVSGDLRKHPVGYFLANVVKYLAAEGIELHAYSNSAREDELSAELRRHCAGWRRIDPLSDQAVADLIREERIDLLLDLSGHTALHRLGIFARHPAPVQASWLGYFATTGVAEIDYFIGDPHVAPPSEDAHFLERIWRLPETYLCFAAPDDPLPSGPSPMRANGHVTFGSFNNLVKLNGDVIGLWSRVLQDTPDSRLFLKTQGLADPFNRDRLFREFGAHGIAPERLRLEGPSPRHELLACYQQVDIALDPFPYPGGTTSVEALWMGVPVLTRRGERFLSRVGESIAANAGMADWIAENDDDYRRRAIDFAARPDYLAGLRDGLRERLAASPLCDAPRFAAHFAQALKHMYRQKTTHSGDDE